MRITCMGTDLKKIKQKVVFKITIPLTLLAPSPGAAALARFLRQGGALQLAATMQQRQVFTCSLCNLTLPFEVSPITPAHFAIIVTLLQYHGRRPPWAPQITFLEDS